MKMLAIIMSLMPFCLPAYAETLITQTATEPCAARFSDADLDNIVLKGKSSANFKLTKRGRLDHGRMYTSFSLIGDDSSFQLYNGVSDGESGGCHRPEA